MGDAAFDAFSPSQVDGPGPVEQIYGDVDEDILEAFEVFTCLHFLEQLEQHVSDDCHMDLDQNGVPAFTNEAFDLQVLLEPFEQKFNCPALFVPACDLLCGCRQIV